MEDPKKDYEALMQYLQGAPAKRQPASVRDKAVRPEWNDAPQASENLKPIPQAPVANKGMVTKFNRSFFKLSRQVRILIAVVASALFIFILIQAFAFYKLTAQSIYQQLYTPFATETTRGTVTKNSIEAYYSAGNFVAATLQAKQQATRTNREHFLTGLAYLQRNDYSNSIKWLEPVAVNFKNEYRQPAEYYLALAYLQNGDYDRCIALAEQIAFAPRHPYNKYFSKDVLTDLKMLKWK